MLKILVVKKFEKNRENEGVWKKMTCEDPLARGYPTAVQLNLHIVGRLLASSPPPSPLRVKARYPKCFLELPNSHAKIVFLTKTKNNSSQSEFREFSKCVELFIWEFQTKKPNLNYISCS